MAADTQQYAIHKMHFWDAQSTNCMQVDIWALGISAIEMAETIPPRWSVHPMRVIFQISREEPPRLAEWEKWSLNFHDFVRLCLIKDCRSRPTAAQLEQHRLVAQSRTAGPPNVAPLVARARQFISAKAAVAADTFNSRASTHSTVECVPMFSGC
jgi:serine/threonine protein kinase